VEANKLVDRDEIKKAEEAFIDYAARTGVIADKTIGASLDIKAAYIDGFVEATAFYHSFCDWTRSSDAEAYATGCEIDHNSDKHWSLYINGNYCPKCGRRIRTIEKPEEPKDGDVPRA
jgi:hypothetical protein